MSDEIPSCRKICGTAALAKYSVSLTPCHEKLQCQGKSKDQQFQEFVNSKEGDNKNDSVSNQPVASNHGAIRKRRRIRRKPRNSKPPVVENVQSFPQESEFPPLRPIPSGKGLFPTDNIEKNTSIEQPLNESQLKFKRTYADVVNRTTRQPHSYQGALSREKSISVADPLELGQMKNTLEMNNPQRSENPHEEQVNTSAPKNQSEEENTKIDQLVTKLWHYGPYKCPENVEQSTSYFSDPFQPGCRMPKDHWAFDTNSVLDDLEHELRKFDFAENSTVMNKSTNQARCIEVSPDRGNMCREKMKSKDSNSQDVNWIHYKNVPNFQNTQHPKENNFSTNDKKYTMETRMQNQYQNQTQNEMGEKSKKEVEILVQEQKSNHVQSQDASQLQMPMQFQQMQPQMRQIDYHQMGLQKAMEEGNLRQMESAGNFERRPSYSSLPEVYGQNCKDRKVRHERGAGQQNQAFVEQSLPDKNNKFQYQHFQKQNPKTTKKETQDRACNVNMDSKSRSSRRQRYQPPKMLSPIPEYQPSPMPGPAHNHQNLQWRQEQGIPAVQEPEWKGVHGPPGNQFPSRSAANWRAKPQHPNTSRDASRTPSSKKNYSQMNVDAEFQRGGGQHFPQNVQYYSDDEIHGNFDGKWSRGNSRETDDPFSRNRSATGNYTQHYPQHVQKIPQIQSGTKMRSNKWSNFDSTLNRKPPAEFPVYEENVAENYGQHCSRNNWREREKQVGTDGIANRKGHPNWAPKNYAEQSTKCIQQLPQRQPYPKMQVATDPSWNWERQPSKMYEEESKNAPQGTWKRKNFKIMKPEDKPRFPH